MATKTFTAEAIFEYIKVGTRDTGDTYYYFKSSTPDSLRNAWQEFTSDYDDYNFSELDEYYGVLYTLTTAMLDNDNFTENDLYEIDWCDDYYADRLDWLKDNLGRAKYYYDVIDNGAEGIFQIIGDMQQYARSNFASAVYYKFLGGK